VGFHRVGFAIAGALLVAAVIADSLAPVTLQVRTGLHYLVEHFLAYFTVTMFFSVALQRPFIVAGVVMALAALIEALQGLTADRIPDIPTALSGAAGALSGALLVILLRGLFKTRKVHPASAMLKPPMASRLMKLDIASNIAKLPKLLGKGS